MRQIEDAPLLILLHQLAHFSRYQAVKRMETMDLKPSQAGILFTLACEGEMSQKKLAQKIGITPPSMTVALRKLESRGYIQKETDEKDQRISRIRLSEEGKKQIQELRNIMESMEENLYRGMSNEEKILIRRLLLEMRKNLLNTKEFHMDMDSVMEKTCPTIRHDF